MIILSKWVKPVWLPNMFKFRWQLLATYYITLVIGISLATIIYSTEAAEQGIEDTGYTLQILNGTSMFFTNCFFDSVFFL